MNRKDLLKISLTMVFAFLFNYNSIAQSLNPDRVEKIKKCTVRLMIDSIPIGTGFLINDKGFVLTCWHVANFSIIRNANNIPVGLRTMYMELNGGNKIKVGIAGYFLQAGNKNAVAYDYCLIVPVPMGITNPTPYLKLGDYDEVKEGQEVYTCGYPLGIPQQFISKGILSTKYREKNNTVITNGHIDTLPRNQSLLDLTMNRETVVAQ